MKVRGYCSSRQLLTLIVLSTLAIDCTLAGFLFFGNSGSNSKLSGSDNKDDSKRFLPKLPPHEDNCYLMEFHSDGNEVCKQMEPVLERLENDLSTKFRKINVYRRQEFMGLLESIGFDECGQLPFFYNRRTGQAICGATSYLNLKRWGTGDLSHLFQDAPDNILEEPEYRPAQRRDVGFKGFFEDKLKQLESIGKSKAEDETVKQSAERKAKSEQGSSETTEAAERLAARRAARDTQE